MSGFSRFFLIIGLSGLGAACSSLEGAGPAPLLAFPDLPAFSAAPPTGAVRVQEANRQAKLVPDNVPTALAQSQGGQEPLAPEANIQAAGGPVKAAVLPGLISLGYKVATDTTFSTVLTKLSGSRLSTIRLTVTFASIGTHTRVIVDMRRTAPGTSETESALDHPDRNAIQANLNQVKVQVEARAVAPPPPAQASGAPVPLGQPSPPPAISATPTALPAPAQASIAPQPVTPGAPARAPALAPTAAIAPASPSPAPAGEPEPAQATPSWFPQFPRIGFPAPAGGNEQAPAPAAAPPVQQAAPAEPPPPAEQRPLARQRANPLSEWLPNLPPPNLPNLFPPAQSDAPPDDRPLRKGQTRARL